MNIDLDRLLKLRALIARIGEMDNARWWNTSGQLGPLGTTALRRGFPRTHHFAQARSVFAVAAHRCAEVFDPPGCITLWSLPAAIEDSFDARWEHWIDSAEDWAGFFSSVEQVSGTDVSGALRTAGLASAEDIETSVKLRRSAEGRAVQIPGTHQPNDTLLTQLALGFARGEPGALAVPYARLDDQR